MAERPDRPRMSGRARVLVASLVAICIGAIVVAVAMALWGSLDKDTLWFEIGKLIAQLGFITGFGAIATLLVYEFQRDQEEAQQRVADRARQAEVRQEWLRSILTRTATAYTDLKQARRTLQAAVRGNGGVDGGGEVPADIYRDQLDRISAVQSDFENLHTEVMSYVPEESAQGVESGVSEQLHIIENSLSGLITEWKNVPRAKEPGSPAAIAVAKLKALRLFLARSDDSTAFANGFGAIRGAYKSIETAIWRQLRDDTQASRSSEKHS